MTENEERPNRQSMHLPHGTIHGAICRHLRELGYDIDTETLRIYGYGEDERKELQGIQGHIDVFNLPERQADKQSDG